jgi:fumarate hydratase class II
MILCIAEFKAFESVSFLVNTLLLKQIKRPIIMNDIRIERDSMGEVEVPADALYRAQTQRAVNHFQFSGRAMPKAFITALAQVKWAAAKANAELGELPLDIAAGIADAAEQVIKGLYWDQFPVDVFQTGSGTSSNMNMNEVLASLATKTIQLEVHANDHVNRGQSSNDVIPSAIQVSVATGYKQGLKPSLEHLIRILKKRAKELDVHVKTGRTHLMDAMPLTLGQELNTWAFQLEESLARFDSALPRVLALGLGGTAIGTGINAHPKFSKIVVAHLLSITGTPFTSAANLFSRISAQDSVVEFSGHMKVLAVVLMKIANDLRWMNSGPLAGLAEIELEALQPGSSIMPGKVNPVIPEAVCMLSAQVMGNDTTITVAGQSGNFQLNTMLPVIADRLLDSLQLLSNGCQQLADRAIDRFKVNEAQLAAALTRNPILVTALNPVIGYEKAAEIAKQAYQQGKSIQEVAANATELSEEDLKKLLDPRSLSFPHGS